jgi:energy-coupling factor transporter ATP-binding protein EcfA2
VAEAIRTEGLTKRYGHTTALDGLDLVVEPGEVFGYLGPNGAGKSTTIALLLGLIRPTAGTARLFGLDAWADVAEAHRRWSARRLAGPGGTQGGVGGPGTLHNALLPAPCAPPSRSVLAGQPLVQIDHWPR